MHYEANRSRRVTFAEDFGNLTVSHNVSMWNHTNNSEDAFPVVVICFSGHKFSLDLVQGSKYDAGRSAVATATRKLQRQAKQFINAWRNCAQVEAFNNHYAVG